MVPRDLTPSVLRDRGRFCSEGGRSVIERGTCIRCGGEMAHIGQEKIQLGKYGWLTGSWAHLLSGALTVDIYCCTECKKLEFYAVAPPEEEARIAQIPCPFCGELHDMDDAKCPHCGERLY